ncbi:YlxR family protein [Salibacterium salarium]|uniref:YlxR family protein n=1 Tax=Salibacterium salarium TaxID=284579 RepID=A0A428N4H4_9BACI|nr:YlxR family protein [Salibacterium salarium]RSL33206.1 YlxR family protein [Salibacterium salarium]
MKKKKPIRKCIVTGETMEKKELIRVVRSPEGEIFVDHSGKKNGRGAYLTNNEQCFLEAKKKDALSRHLNVKVSEEDYERLLEERKKGTKR